MTSPRIVMITSGAIHGVRILRALERRGVQLDCVVFMGAASWAECTRRRPDEHPIRTAALAPARWMFRRLRARRAMRHWPRRAFRRIIISGGMKSAGLPEDLRRLRPDVLVLGSHEVAGAEVLSTASAAVLNTHPGLLPWLRGSGVVGHALRQGIAIGATCHHAIARVDAGPIVERRLLNVAPGSTSLRELEVQAMELAAEVMANVLEEITCTRKVPEGLKQESLLPILHWPPPPVTAECDALARAGRAYRLLELWRPHCTDPVTLALPNLELEAPSDPEPATHTGA